MSVKNNLLQILNAKEISTLGFAHGMERQYGISHHTAKSWISPSARDREARRTPSADNLHCIAEFLHCSIDDLFDRTEDAA